jgi:predicted metal-dependent peptidase
MAADENLVEQELDRVRALRTTLVISHPFFATLLLPMRILVSRTLPTFAATNGFDTVWINPAWTAPLNLRQLGYVLVHEAGHVALLHAIRKGDREHTLWNDACTTPGALILGPNAPIETVNSGQTIYHAGGIGTVIRPMTRPYQGDLITIKATGLLPIELTPEHPVYASYRQKHGHPIILSEPSWIPAQYLRQGDYLVVPRLEGTISITSVPLTEFLHPPYTDSLGRRVTHQHRLSKTLANGFPLTSDTAWFMGMYVAEGSKAQQHTGIKFSLGSHETTLASRLAAVAKALGYKASISRRSSTQTVTICSSIFNRAFTGWFGRGARNKRIPEFILYGYTDGDGHRSPRRSTHLATASQLLATQLQLLLARLGTLALVTKRINPARHINRATLPPQTLYEIVHRHRRPSTRLLNPKHGQPIASHNFRSHVFPNHIATRISQITRSPYIGPVHNLTTDSHSYLLSNAVVHNCDLATNGMIDGIQGDKGKPLYERPDGVEVPGLGAVSLLHAHWAKDLAAEQIYERLLQETPQATCHGRSGKEKRGGATDGASSSPDTDDGSPSSPAPGVEPDWSQAPCRPGQTCAQVPTALSTDQAEQLVDRVIAAHEAWLASSQRGTMPAGVLRLIERLRAAKVPWERVLHQYAGSALRKDDYSLFPPHRRWLMEADLIRPSLRSEGLAQLVVVVDTSGSITRPLLEAFAAEVTKLATLADETLLLTHDAAVHQVIRTAALPAFLRTLDFRGGGGTSHVPVFDWLRERRQHPDLLIALTDLHSAYPEQAPRFPVLWCACENHGSPPAWGRVLVIPDQHV